MAGALLAAFGRSRHWLAAGAGTGLLTSFACVAFFAVSLTHLDPRSFRELEFYAHGEELPRLLAFSEEVLEAGESYADSYDRTLDLGQDAWDIYLLYGPGTRWDSADPPTPAYWMNQLGGANGPTLDSQTFTDHARALLRQPAR